METKIQRMKELIPVLKEAGKAYYQESREIMSNFEYDRLYDELASLEEETGVILSGSPTQQVGYEVLSELPQGKHMRHLCCLWIRQKVQRITGVAWQPERPSFLENGWAHHCTDL